MKPRTHPQISGETLHLLLTSLATLLFLVLYSTIIASSPSATSLLNVEVAQAKPQAPTGRGGRKAMYVETITHSPRILVARNFLSDEESQHLIDAGIEKGMEVALITPYGTNKLVPSSSRTNTAAWLNFRHDAIVADIEDRIAVLTGTVPEQAENMQILHYKDRSQQFTEHRDYSDPEEGDPIETLANGGNRMCTVIIYLVSPEEGGDTYFTRLGISVKPNRGDAVVFWNTKLNKNVDRSTYHAGMPPIVGEKWVATKWIHDGIYQKTAEAASAERNGDDNQEDNGAQGNEAGDDAEIARKLEEEAGRIKSKKLIKGRPVSHRAAKASSPK